MTSRLKVGMGFRILYNESNTIRNESNRALCCSNSTATQWQEFRTLSFLEDQLACSTGAHSKKSSDSLARNQKLFSSL